MQTLTPEQAVQQAVQQAEKAIREAADRHLGDARLVLFGSRASGRARRRSDFDLAVIPGPGFSRSALSNFREALEESSKIIYPIDIVDFREVSPELRARIEQEGVVWKS